ncbi:hypothetical protein CCHR01_14950 [Colletotrichum chrysophilum]|uniref:Uncharacterized protein n=1 Tax=Colletotrichum chrysophilum TaxID=1836956 RepID=A0AAD9A730_9PEZI|nr:hypothetical protein CCHR01_14950 [Colletotrichum chrysophilum]
MNGHCHWGTNARASDSSKLHDFSDATTHHHYFDLLRKLILACFVVPRPFTPPGFDRRRASACRTFGPILHISRSMGFDVMVLTLPPSSERSSEAKTTAARPTPSRNIDLENSIEEIRERSGPDFQASAELEPRCTQRQSLPTTGVAEDI